MKTITLQTAVALAIQELLALGGFSAYEATTLIRQRVDNDYLISDCDVDENDITQIYHAKVRAIISELYDNGLFKADRSYDSNGINRFMIYKPVGVPNTAATPQQSVVTVPPSSYGSDIVRKVFAYLSNNGSGTIRQIHSSLKTKGITYEDIAKILGVTKCDVPLSKVVVP